MDFGPWHGSCWLPPVPIPGAANDSLFPEPEYSSGAVFLPGLSQRVAHLSHRGWHTPIMELMWPDPICALDSLSVEAARLALVDQGVEVIAIVDPDGRPLGTLLRRDFSDTRPHRPKRSIVREIMTPAPASIHRSARLSEVVGILELAAGRPLPVVDDEGRLVGLLPPAAELESLIRRRIRKT